MECDSLLMGQSVAGFLSYLARLVSLFYLPVIPASAWEHYPMLKIAIVTNCPAPYRVPVYQRLAQVPGIKLQVIFCCRREPNRLWDLPPLEFDHAFLRDRFITWNDRYIHHNMDVFSCLDESAPDVIVTDGFNPTHLYAFAYAHLKGRAHVAMTDGTAVSEQTLSRLHRIARCYVFGRSDAFIFASNGGRKLFESYGVAPERCYKSALCIDNGEFAPGLQPLEEKRFDFIFCGRIETVKNPHFALKVARQVALRLGRKIKILFVGAGSQELSVRNAAAQHGDQVQAQFNGFARQQELPSLYRSSRIFLFPTQWDPWGVVANEACAAGLPVIVSPHAGAAGELVRDGENGFICELSLDQWTERAVLLLTRPDLLAKFSGRSRSIVREYTFENAAAGILAACSPHFRWPLQEAAPEHRRACG
jgi:glycosyltransferase involved in cell wall biosynthesis